MKIEKIIKLKSGKYKLEFDNKEKIVTYDEVILNNNLLFNKEVNYELLNEINNQTNYYDNYYKVFKYISTKMRSKEEINKYLEKINVSEKDKTNIMEKLINIGLLNDEKYVKAFISDKILLSNYGPNKIKKELLEHNIDYEVINMELDKCDKNVFKEKLMKLLMKKVKSNHKYSKYQLKQKMMEYFINLGYTKDMINECLDEIDLKDDGIIEKEYQKIYNRLSKKYSADELNYQIKNKLYQKGFSIEQINEVLKNE